MYQISNPQTLFFQLILFIININLNPYKTYYMLRQYPPNQYEEITPWQTNESSRNFNLLFDPDLHPLDSKPNKQKLRKENLLPKMEERTRTGADKKKSVFSTIQHSFRKDNQVSRNMLDPLHNQQREKLIKSSAKLNRIEGKYQALQEVEIKKFFMEGECKRNKENYYNKKRQSAFVRKQRFAEMRKSVNVPEFNLIIKEAQDYVGTKQDKLHPILQFFKTKN